MNVLIFCGSTRAASFTRAGLMAAADVLRESGVATEMWDPAGDPLPIADPRYHRNPAEHPDSAVRDLVARAHRADGFILGTPVYHNSYSGVLKNALDHLTYKEFMEKPVALMAHGSTHTSIQAVDHLRIVMRSFHALVIPDQVLTRPEEFAEGHLTDPEVIGRVQRMCKGLLKFALAGRGA